MKPLVADPPTFDLLHQDPSKKHAIIVDIDGTVAKMTNRGPYEWDKVHQDEPYTDMVLLIKILSAYYKILFVSGRDSVCLPDTYAWLHKTFGFSPELYMRAEGDKRKDSIIKYEILQELIKSYYIAYVFDDRDQVVSMWRQAGLRCLQVASGDF